MIDLSIFLTYSLTKFFRFGLQGQPPTLQHQFQHQGTHCPPPSPVFFKFSRCGLACLQFSFNSRSHMPVLFSEFCGAANFSIIFCNNSCVRFWFFIRTYEESAMQSHSADFLEACQSSNFELIKLYDVEVDFWSHWTLLFSDFQISRNASKGWRRESQRNSHILVSDLADSPWCASVCCFTVQRTWKATSWTLPNA